MKLVAISQILPSLSFTTNTAAMVKRLTEVREVIGRLDYQAVKVNDVFELVQDGVSPQTTNFEYVHPTNGCTILCVDDQRFLNELLTSDVDKLVNLCLPGLPMSIHKPGEYLVVTTPVTALDTDSINGTYSIEDMEELKLGTVLTDCGFSYNTENPYTDLPCWKLPLKSYQVKAFFGSDVDGMFDLVKQFSRLGIGEARLGMLQMDNSKNMLQSASSLVGGAPDITSSELDSLRDVLQISNAASHDAYDILVDSMRHIKYVAVKSGSETDDMGLSVSLMYAAFNPTYLLRLPLDVLKAIGNPDQNGAISIKSVDGNQTNLSLSVPPAIIPKLLPLGSLTDNDLAVLYKARYFYRVLMCARFLQANKFGLSPYATVSKSKASSFIECVTS